MAVILVSGVMNLAFHLMIVFLILAGLSGAVAFFFFYPFFFLPFFLAGNTFSHSSMYTILG